MRIPDPEEPFYPDPDTQRRLKHIRHQRKSVEKLLRAIEFFDSDETTYEYRLQRLLALFYGNQPGKLYEVICGLLLSEGRILFPEDYQPSFEGFMRFKTEQDEYDKRENFYSEPVLKQGGKEP